MSVLALFWRVCMCCAGSRISANDLTCGQAPGSPRCQTPPHLSKGLYRGQRLSEKSLPMACEAARISRTEQSVDRNGGDRVKARVATKPVRESLCHKGSRIEHGDILWNHICESRIQQWIVGATKKQGVDVGQVAEVATECGAGEVGVLPAFFDQRRQQPGGT